MTVPVPPRPPSPAPPGPGNAPPAPPASPATPSPPPSPPSPGPTPTPSALPVDGTTEVLAGVVAKVAAITARGIPGVAGLGTTGAQALGAARRALGATAREEESTAGVRVNMDGDTARISMDVVIDYRPGTRALIRALRRTVPASITELTGVRVLELDIVIADVRLPGETSGAAVSPG